MEFDNREELALSIYKKIPRCGCWPCTGFIGARKQMGKMDAKRAQLIAKKKGFADLEAMIAEATA